MPVLPLPYDNNTPKLETSLSPLQLALAKEMAAGAIPFAPNQRFLQALRIFADSRPWDGGIYKKVEFINYQARGDDIYGYRRAPDCGPEENRFEYTYIGKRADIAVGSWTYYGLRIAQGVISNGSGYSGPDSKSDSGTDSGTGGGGGMGTDAGDGGGMCGAGDNESATGDGEGNDSGEAGGFGGDPGADAESNNNGGGDSGSDGGSDGGSDSSGDSSGAGDGW